MQRIITDISNNFITEALASPRMLEDLAAMEKYMSESYDGRTFVELLQNADDAKSNRVKVFLVNDTLIVANDGRPFDDNDIMAICRSGASSKQRGSNIGYRGVGFKSATAISTEIVIHSAGTCFTFSKSICAQQLGKTIDQVPTVRIPFLFDRQNLGYGVINAIEACKQTGFTTFFVFLNAKVDKFLSEAKDFSSGWLLFLKKISEVVIECGSFKKKCVLKRTQISDTDTLLNVGGNNDQWYVVSRDNVSIAFKYDSLDGILPCEPDDAVFHCFLPTLDKTGFPFKANADFSTDPSRKHIINDGSTSKALQNIQCLFADMVNRIVHSANEKLYPVLSLLNTHTTLNALVTQFETGLLEKLRSSSWVPLNNGQYTRPGNTKTYPQWLDSLERNAIFTKSVPLAQNAVQIGFVDKVEKLAVLLNKLGSTEITIIELSGILANTNYVKHIPVDLIGKVFAYSYRAMALDSTAIGNLFVPTKKGFTQLADSSNTTELDAQFVAATKSVLNAREAESLQSSFEAFAILQKRNGIVPNASQHTSPAGSITQMANIAMNKWKSPVQNCIAIETANGNTAKDVSRKCNEYSVISTDSEGNSFYIAVKTVGVLGEPFKLSESEYSAAQEFGDKYKVYLFTTDTSNIKHAVIANPINAMPVKRVVKEWEWLFGSDTPNFADLEDCVFSTVDFEDNIVDFDNMDGHQFERFCAHLLIKNGYEDVTLTKTSGDQGIDIIAYRDGIKHGIQCKCYSSDIGNSAVQEAFAGKTFYKCNVGIVLTNQHFSSSAIQLAENNGVVLWGREMLMKLIKGSH